MGATGAAGTASGAATPTGPRPERHWWAGSESGLPEGLGWLSSRERARLTGMRFTKRRTEYLLRRWVGKRAVAARLAMPHDDPTLARVELLNRPTGAPYLEVDTAAVPWEVTLTDRAGCAVAVVAPAPHDTSATSATSAAETPGALGVDLELVEPRSVGFVADFLTATEQEWVLGSATDPTAMGTDAAANLVWSAKEAALKVLHLGLRADTRWVEVTVGSAARPDGWSPLAATWRDGEVLPGWWRRDGAYVLTVVTRGESGPPVALPGTTDLAVVRPVHSWVGSPLVTPEE